MSSLILKGEIERDFISQDLLPAGVDEVGRGCLAGPVVAACVVLDYSRLWDLPESSKKLIRDSKTLSQPQRQSVIATIHSVSLSYAIGEASSVEIETHGIANATFLAMNRAIQQIQVPIQILLVDGNQAIRNQTIPQKTVVKGDSLCFTIAAASILAKEHRDQFMKEQAQLFPVYGFESHVGYGTAAHLAAIRSSGICHLHRKNFAPIREMLG